MRNSRRKRECREIWDWGGGREEHGRDVGGKGGGGEGGGEEKGQEHRNNVGSV